MNGVTPVFFTTLIIHLGVNVAYWNSRELFSRSGFPANGGVTYESANRLTGQGVRGSNAGRSREGVRKGTWPGATLALSMAIVLAMLFVIPVAACQGWMFRTVESGIREFMNGTFSGSEQVLRLKDGGTDLVFNPEFAGYRNTVDVWRERAEMEEVRYLAGREENPETLSA